MCLDKCIFTEDDLKNSFKKLHNLKSFTYKEILSKPRILSIDFMRNIVEILPDKLEYLEIYMYANTDEEVSLTFFPRLSEFTIKITLFEGYRTL